jgi:hypothetical protein
MEIVGGLDLHRKQITFDVLDAESGEVRRGRISPADRRLFRGWWGGFAGRHVELALEGCTTRSPSDSAGNAPRCRSHASSPAAATIGCAPSATRPSPRRRRGEPSRHRGPPDRRTHPCPARPGSAPRPGSAHLPDHLMPGVASS